MGIDLHEKCRERLQQLLDSVFPEMIVRNGSHLSFSESLPALWGIDDILSADIRAEAEQLISERPLLEFVQSRLRDKIGQQCKYDREKAPVLLKKLAETVDLSELSSTILDEFCSLPWEYTLTISLPEVIGSRIRGVMGEEIPLSSSFRIVSPTPELLEDYPLPPPSIASFFETTKWTDTVCLRHQSKGFIAEFGETVPLMQYLSLVKAFAGVGLALRMFEFRRQFTNRLASKFVVVHRKVPGGWETEESHSLDNDLAEGLDSLVIDEIEGLDEKKQANFTKYVLLQMKAVFGYEDSQESIDRIQLAGQWLFDSYSTRSDLLSFVQAMVSLEILLGDKRTSDLMGLGELLRNRCAYLIGESHSQRQEILKEFKDIYDIRSNIVHSGKNRLSETERELKSKLLWYCGRAIQEELGLLVSDRRNEKKVPGNT